MKSGGAPRRPNGRPDRRRYQCRVSPDATASGGTAGKRRVRGRALALPSGGGVDSVQYSRDDPATRKASVGRPVASNARIERLPGHDGPEYAD